MRKTWIAVAAAASMAVMMTTGAFAREDEKFEAGGIAFEIPEDIYGMVTIKTDEDDLLVSVYETASVEAAEALGEDNDGAGWIFGIAKLPESRVKELRCGGMDGMEVFAEDDDMYLLYIHPTDVRFVREKEEEYDEGIKQWGQICEWASENVRAEILANDPEWEPEVYTNTMLDMCLANAAYKAGTNYAVHSLNFKGQDLPIVDAEDHLEDLAEDFTYGVDNDLEAPDGEYLVLEFPDKNIRYDFFPTAGYENMIREVYTMEDGEEIVTMYVAVAKDTDEDDTPAGIMQDWCEDILEGDD